jgi:hypothetical protein
LALSGIFPTDASYFSGNFPLDVIFPEMQSLAMKSEIEYLQERIPLRLEAIGKKAAPAAKEAGLGDSFIRDILRKGTMPSAKNLAQLALALRTTDDYLLGRTDKADASEGPRTTTIVGRAGAATDGRVVYSDAQEGLGEVLIPEGASLDSKAIEIEGYSMGFIADGALIFYTEVHQAPEPDMLGMIVVVGLDNGEVLLKKLLRGSRPGLYDLESINGPTLHDRQVVWAAHIDSIVPPWRAKRLRVDAGDVKL